LYTVSVTLPIRENQKKIKIVFSMPFFSIPIAFLRQRYYNTWMKNRDNILPPDKHFDVILPIHPQYVRLIERLEKQFEFRKIIFNRPVRNFFLYATAPQKKITGWFPYTGDFKGSILDVWEYCREYPGISKDEYLKYYSNRSNAYAIFINNYVPYPEYIDPKKLFPDFIAPQSYCYVEGKIK
jgi:predicted transcriptional regulator